VIEAIVRASHLFSGFRRLAIRQAADSAPPTHALIQHVLGGLICAHVDSPCGNVSQQHRAEPSIQSADAVF
jgi:hypothetical protein